MPIELTVLTFMILANIMLLAIIPYRKFLRSISLYFVLSIVLNIFWTIGIFLVLSSNSYPLFKAGEFMFILSPLLSSLFIFFFGYTFPSNCIIDLKKSAILSLPALIVGIVYSVGLLELVKKPTFSGGLSIIEINPWQYLMYGLSIIFYFFGLYIVLAKKYRKVRGIERLQIKYLFIASFVSSFFAFLTNIIMPTIGEAKFIWLGPVFSLAYIVLIPIAITKYKLFDIRNIAVKSLSYIASLAVMVLFASIITQLIVMRVDLASLGQSSQIILIILLILMSVVMFEFVNNKFNSIAQKLYFSKQVQSQDLLNTINDTLVKSNNAQDLLIDIGNILRDATDSNLCGFYIKADSKKEYYTTNNKKSIFDQQAWGDLKDKLLISKQPYLYVDSQDIDQQIKNYMRSLDIELLIKMEANNDDIGYLIIGNRYDDEPFSSQEIQTLEIIADEIAITLQSLLRFEEIARFNITLQQEIDEATKELQQTNSKLKNLDGAKDEFISMASHQLRTPLTSIKGYISMLLEGDAGEINEQQKNFLSQAFISSQRMVFLISDLLNVSRLKTGKFVIEKTEVNLPEMVALEIEQLATTAEARGLSLEFKPPKNFPIMRLDEMKTLQVIMNFIDNAIYYTPKGGKIRIELSADKEKVTYKVIDNGIGVPKAVQHELFTKFYRAENAKKARPDGTGLGLYMAKKVIIAQGGHLIFKSEEGKGSTFGFSFPINAPQD